jgi:autotransporter-associated beta strand protein
MMTPTTAMKDFVTSLVACCFCLALSSQIKAQSTITWTGATDGNWATGTNWSSSPALPGTGDHILFNDVTNQSITLGADRTIGNLTFNAADAYTLNAGNSLIFGTSGLSITQSGAGTVGISSGLNWGANGITLAGAGAGQVTLNALTGTSTIQMTGGNYRLNVTNASTLTGATKWNLTGGQLTLGGTSPTAAWLGAAQASLTGDFITLNGGRLNLSAAAGNMGNRGMTIGTSATSTIDVGNVSNYDALTFNVANSFLGSGKVILQNGNSGLNTRALTFTAAQTSFNGTIQLGNGATSRAPLVYFQGGGNYTFSGNFEFNDTLNSGANLLQERSGASVVTLGGNITFTGTSFEQPNALLSRFNGGRLDLGSTSTVSAASGVTGWLGFRAGGDAAVTNQVKVDGTITNGSGNVSLVFLDGGGNYMSYKVTGNNTYTGGGTIGGSSATGRFGNITGTQIQQGIVYLGHNNAFGASTAGNPISIFRATGGQPGVYTGMLSDTGTDFTLGNQQTITVRPLNSAVSLFTIGGNGAVNTTYNNPIVINNPAGGGPADLSAGFAILLQQAANGKTTFAGSITQSGWTSAAMKAPIFEKTGAGTVVLQNANSSIAATPVIRDGTLLVEANAPATGTTGVLGNPTTTGSTFGQKTDIQLGGARNASGAANVRIATIADIGGTYSATGGANGNGQLTGVTNNSTALNSTTLAVGDRVLVMLQGNSQNISTAPVNGIYTVSAVGGTLTLDRTSDAVGIETWVTASVVAGKINSGKTFYLANQNTTFNNGGASGTVQVWLEDEGNNLSATLNPALLTNAAVTIARPITVNSSPAIQSSTLGGNSDHNSTFSGAVSLNRNLIVTSATTGTNATSFTGTLNDSAGSFSVTKAGNGSVILGAAAGNTYDGGTAVNAGTLLVNNTTGSGTGTGAVTTASSTILGGTGTLSPTGSNAITINGSLAPGSPGTNSGVGTLTFTPASGNATLSSTSTADFQLLSNGKHGYTATYNGDGTLASLSGTYSGGGNDRLVFNGGAAGNLLDLTSLGSGNFNVTFASGYTPMDQDLFDLLDWANLSGSGSLNNQSGAISGLSTSQLDLPSLSGGLAWDTSFWVSHGVIGIYIVPEPSRALLVLGGMISLMLRRRRLV